MGVPTAIRNPVIPGAGMLPEFAVFGAYKAEEERLALAALERASANASANAATVK